MAVKEHHTGISANEKSRGFLPLQSNEVSSKRCEGFHRKTIDSLISSDRPVWEQIEKEYTRQKASLQLVAAENRCSAAVLAALGSILQNKTAEGPAGERLHGGCRVVDEIERLAIERAKETFNAQYANVQPHSGTQANQIVLNAVLQKGDKILSLPDEQGGHFSHGSTASITGKLYKVEHYHLDKKTFRLDYDEIRKKAKQCRPKMIICGASAYPRVIDFGNFRKIADEAGAFLLADISHISGLIIAGAHPSSINFAHFTTTSTYKPGGPRGGLILMGKDHNQKINFEGKSIAIEKLLEQSTFPGIQGTPYFNHIAAKAVFFSETLSDEYRHRQFKIVENAKRLASGLVKAGLDVVTTGTDNHLVLVNVSVIKKGLTGDIAQKVLEECGIVVDKIDLPYQKKGITSGIRLGTPIVTKIGMGPEQMELAALLVCSVLRAIKLTGRGGYEIDRQVRHKAIEEIAGLCKTFDKEDF